MEKAMSICKKEPEDEQTTKKVDHFVFLSDDILLDILKRLPEPFLGYRAKYVCRRWLDVISKMILTGRASFILQKWGDMTARHVGIREEGEEGLQVKMQDLDIARIGRIRSWDNEFLLFSKDEGKKRSLYVYNLLTKEVSSLPKRNASCGGDFSLTAGVALSFDRFKGIYKVVHLSSDPPIECHILILQSNIVSSKWKKIQVPCMNELGCLWLSGTPVSVQGRYIHWSACSYQRLISMDMVKEEIVDRSLSSLPFTGWKYQRSGCRTIFKMGDSLALFAEVSWDKSEIWILKDFQRNKWEKLQSVALNNCNSSPRIPVIGVISSNKYIILKCIFNQSMWYHDLNNGVLKELDIHFNFTSDLRDICVVHYSH